MEPRALSRRDRALGFNDERVKGIARTQQSANGEVPSAGSLPVNRAAGIEKAMTDQTNLTKRHFLKGALGAGLGALAVIESAAAGVHGGL